MATKSIAWNDGSGDYITLTYNGQGDGAVTMATLTKAWDIVTGDITLT